MAAPPTASEQERENAMWERVNLWKRYRNEPLFTLDEIRTHYRARNFIRTPIAPDPTLTGNIVAYQGGVPLPRAVPNAIQQAWLGQTPAGLPNAGQHWNGTRFIYGDDGKSIGLWEYQPPAGVASVQRNVKALVIKETLADNNNRDYSFYNEHYYMDQLARTRSNHILRSPYPPIAYGDEPLPDAVRSIFLEYCPLGDLWDLLALRRNT